MFDTFDKKRRFLVKYAAIFMQSFFKGEVSASRLFNRSFHNGPPKPTPSEQSSKSLWRFQSFEESSVGLFVIDRLGRIIDTNKKAAILIGCPKESIVKTMLRSMLDEHTGKKLHYYLSGRSPDLDLSFDCLFKKPSGQYFLARMNVNKCESNGAKGRAFVSFRDISCESSIFRVIRMLAKFPRITSESDYFRERSFLLASLDRVLIPVIGVIDTENESAISIYYVKSSFNFHRKRCDDFKPYLDLFLAENMNKKADKKASCLRALIDLEADENRCYDLHKLIKDPKSNKVLGFVCLILEETSSDDAAMQELLTIVSSRLSEDMLWYRGLEKQAKLQKALENAVDVQTIEMIEQKEKLEKEVEARKLAERKLVAAKQRAEQSNQAKSHFLANMSHEIRTPLNGIIGASSLLSNLTADEQQQKYIETILHSGQVLLNLVNDILDISKIEHDEFSLNIESFSLRKLLHELLDTHVIVARRKGINLVVAYPHNQEDLIWSDRMRVRQILDNLISNAIKFTRTGGVYVYVKLIHRNENCVLNVLVKDTGIGISNEQQNSIWDRFSRLEMSPTRKTSGFGLGLAITAKLLSLMKGRICLESEPGKGSIFNCWIPLEKAEFTDSLIKRHENPIHILVKNSDLKKAIAHMLSVSVCDKLLSCSDFLPEVCQTGSLIFDHAWLEEIKTKASFDFERWLEQIRTRSFLFVQNTHNDADKNFGLRFLTPLDLLVNPGFLGSMKSLLFTNSPNTKRLPVSPYKILMAEDNPINIKVGLDMLRLLGANVSIAENGKAAVYKACEENFDLILMDCFMPEMDGVEAMQTIKRSINNSPPIIAVTANAVKGEKERYLSLGFDDYLSKPYRLDDLQNLLYKCFA